MGESDNDTLNMVAVIGMAVRLPGGIHSPKDMWESIINKRDETCVVPPSRYNINGFHSQTLPYSVGQLKGYFLDEDLALMDAEFFNIPARRAALLDPQQRLLLDCTGGGVDLMGTPGADAQELLVRRVYQKAGIQAIEKTAFVECHGTGITVGDAVEGAVVASTFP